MPKLLLRRGLCAGQRIVIKDRREPPLRLGRRLLLAQGVIHDLVAIDLADAKIMTFRMTEIEAAHRGARPHRKAFGQRHANRALAAKQPEQSSLLGVIGLCRIAGGGTDAAIALSDELAVA